MQTAHNPAYDARAWIRSGFDRLRREPVRWLAMTLVYFAIALALKRIPFLGNFVLVLITPVMLASALLAANSSVLVAAPNNARGWLRALTRDALRELFQVFRNEQHAFAIVIVCIVTLGLVVLMNIPELLITGGSVVSGLTGASLIGPVRPSLLVGIVVVIALYLLLAMALLYLVPLTLFGNRQPVPAVAQSFRACVNHRHALALFVAPFFLLNLIIMVCFSLSRELGYLVLALVGLPTMPLFVLGLHASYRALFERPAAAPAAALGSRVTP